MRTLLLSNDDGYLSPGIVKLANRLAIDYRVVVVAPQTPRSAASHAITLHKPLRLLPATGYDQKVEAWACSGTPTDCVGLGVAHLLKETPPDLVLSGINNGANVAEDTTYSGTVAAAMEGAILGLPAIALSIWSRSLDHLDTAISVTYAIVQQYFDIESTHESWIAFRQGNVFLNVNIPAISIEDVQGIKTTFLGKREYKDIVHEAYDPNGKPYYWIGGEKIMEDSPPGSDIDAVHNNFVSVTPLIHNFTSYQHLDNFRFELR